MQIILQPRQCVTNAPEDYDYAPMRTVIDGLFVDDRGRRYRLAENNDDLQFRSQIARYNSGPFVVLEHQKLLERYIESKWLFPLDNPIMVYRESFDFEDRFGSMTEVEINNLRLAIESVEKLKYAKVNVRKGGLAYDITIRGHQDVFGIVCKQISQYLERPRFD